MILINVLVTGAGGGVGQGIIKSLKMISDLDIKIIAADMSEKAAGLYAADACYLVERCDSRSYMNTLERIFKKEAIDYYFPGTDVELAFCAENKNFIKDAYGVHTVISSMETVSIADDKKKTAQFLKEQGFSYPQTIFADEVDFSAVSYPVIVKPAVGCRSIGVYKVNNERELKERLSNPSGIVIQEHIGTDDSEYTCTVVKVDGDLSPVLVLKRILRSGDTFRAEPVRSTVIENYVRAVASKLDIDGGCNFQLRVDAEGVPKIFEINSRYSGTTPFCSQLGFNPIEFYLKKKEKLNYPFSVSYESVVLRFWSEVVISQPQMKGLEQDKMLVPQLDPQFHLFE